VKLEKYINTGNGWSARRRARRGYSIILVLTTMIFVSMAIMGMTTLFGHEVRRTRGALAEAQLRQLMVAAVPAAQEQLRAGGSVRDVPMSVPVEGASVVLHISGTTVNVDARLRDFKASQTLEFDNGKLVSASLTRTAGQ